jgi:DNA-binding NarL/FixJ family response regulator
MNNVRVLIADDHGVVIEGIKSALGELEGYEVAGTATDGVQALEQVRALRPNIVIMDISMPGMNGVEATKEIKEHFPETRIVIYTMFSDKEYVLELFKAGMDGYILKQDPLSDLLLALDAVRAGGSYFSTKAPKVLSEHLRGEGSVKEDEEENELKALSQREKQIFELLADGKSIKEIARTLFISPKTVESHKYNIMAKLELDSLTELTKLAIRKNLISA